MKISYSLDELRAAAIEQDQITGTWKCRLCYAMWSMRYPQQSPEPHKEFCLLYGSEHAALARRIEVLEEKVKVLETVCGT